MVSVDIERDHWKRGNLRVVGVDEVGRGSLAGPIGVGVVILTPESQLVPGVDDSKKLTSRQRKHLYSQITKTALHQVGYASAVEIDRVGIVRALVMALTRALTHISYDAVLIDGRFAAKTFDWIDVPCRVLVGGDTLCYSIAAASIVAKVERDIFMENLGKRYPHYQFEKNKGYGTKTHRHALRKYGALMHHRKSFIRNI
jgi:ribonuclease HII